MNTLYCAIAPTNSGKSTLIGNYAEQVVYEDDYYLPQNAEDKRTPRQRSLPIVKELLDNGDVAYECFNLTRQDRISLLQDLDDIYCRRVAVYICCSLETALSRCRTKRLSGVNRPITAGTISRMHKMFTPPTLDEGWDEIITVDNNTNTLR